MPDGDVDMIWPKQIQRIWHASPLLRSEPRALAAIAVGTYFGGYREEYLGSSQERELMSSMQYCRSEVSSPLC